MGVLGWTTVHCLGISIWTPKQDGPGVTIILLIAHVLWRLDTQIGPILKVHRARRCPQHAGDTSAGRAWEAPSVGWSQGLGATNLPVVLGGAELGDGSAAGMKRSERLGNRVDG